MGDKGKKWNNLDEQEIRGTKIGKVVKSRSIWQYRIISSSSIGSPIKCDILGCVVEKFSYVQHLPSSKRFFLYKIWRIISRDWNVWNCFIFHAFELCNYHGFNFSFPPLGLMELLLDSRYRLLYQNIGSGQNREKEYKCILNGSWWKGLFRDLELHPWFRCLWLYFKCGLTVYYGQGVAIWPSSRIITYLRKVYHE